MVDFNRDIEECIKVLQAGGIIIYPTDTVWGIGCDATNNEAVNSIYAIKKRTLEKAMIVLVADERDVLQYVASPDLRVFDFLAEIKKPTTVIYKGAIGLAENLTGTDGSVAIRICHDIFCRNLIKRFRKPLVSTSANLSGAPSPSSFRGISRDILEKADYVVKYRQEDEITSEPSALIMWHQDGSHTVIRS